MSAQPATASDSPHYALELEAAKLGTKNQLERFLAGYLPEDELLALARKVLFAPFDGFERWGKDTKVKPFEIQHSPRCPCHPRVGGGSAEVEAEFETAQAGELTHAEWEVYRAMGAARDHASKHPWLVGTSSVTTEPLAHFATCRKCEAEASRMSAKVTIEWAGRKLVREYVLR